MIQFLPTLLMNTHASRRGALVGAGPAAIELSVADDALSGLHQALATGTGTFNRLRHRPPRSPIFARLFLRSIEIRRNVNRLSRTRGRFGKIMWTNAILRHDGKGQEKLPPATCVEKSRRCGVVSMSDEMHDKTERT